MNQNTTKEIEMLKIKDKLEKINDNSNVYMYDNGYMMEISGRDDNGDWATAKIICNTLDDLVTLIKETSTLERD
jgi:hypothetical protein